MMEDIIEKVAQAIALAPYEDKAKAAIQAMREPTIKMQEDGWQEAHGHVDFWDYGGYTGAGYTFEQEGPKAIWQAMIDRALKPHP